MDEKQYKAKIVRSTKKLGIYRAEFLPIIERTAQLYALRDQIAADFEESGGHAVVEHTNKAGATNIVKNPYLVALNDVETQLIVHERELGLTASALKKINEQGLRVKKTSSLAEVLKDLDRD